MSFLMFVLSVILCILSFRLRGRDRFLVQLASLIMVIYDLHVLHVF